MPSFRRPPSLAGLAAVTALAVAAPAAQADASVTSGATADAAAARPSAVAARSSAGLEREMRALIDRVRRSHGRPSLASNFRLERAAAAKARKIGAVGEFSHTPGGTSFRSTFAAAGFRGRTMGENLAYGSGKAGSPRAILRSWMRSPGHRANLLNGGFRLQGLDVRTVTLPGVGKVRLWTHTFGG